MLKSEAMYDSNYKTWSSSETDSISQIHKSTEVIELPFPEENKMLYKITKRLEGPKKNKPNKEGYSDEEWYGEDRFAMKKCYISSINPLGDDVATKLASLFK